MGSFSFLTRLRSSYQCDGLLLVYYCGLLLGLLLGFTIGQPNISIGFTIGQPNISIAT